MAEVKHYHAVTMRKPNLIYTIVLLCLSWNLVCAQRVVPDCPPKNPVDCVQKGDACDPVFFQTDPMSNLGMLLFQQSEVQMVLQLKERGSLVRSEVERRLMEGFNQVSMVGDGEKIYRETLKVWGSGASSDIQRYALLTAIGLMESTREKEVLRFLLKTLDNPDEQKAEVLRLASGNGLQRRKASQLLSVLRENPRFGSMFSGTEK
jgi:hypothetical protein